MGSRNIYYYVAFLRRICTATGGISAQFAPKSSSIRRNSGANCAVISGAICAVNRRNLRRNSGVNGAICAEIQSRTTELIW